LNQPPQAPTERTPGARGSAPRPNGELVGRETSAAAGLERRREASPTRENDVRRRLSSSRRLCASAERDQAPASTSRAAPSRERGRRPGARGLRATTRSEPDEGEGRPA